MTAYMSMIRSFQRLPALIAASIDRFTSPERRLPLSARPETAQPFIDPMADPRASKPASRTHQF